MSIEYDLAVVGSGFGGSLLASVARRAGRRVVLIEKGRHPRFAMGESTTPLSNLLLEEIAERYGLEGMKPLTKWGSWQRHYPDLPSGLKRGFTFYSHRLEHAATPQLNREEQLLVAASPHDDISDTHWYRAAFDHFVLREAQSAGADYFDQTALSGFEESASGVRLTGVREGKAVEFRAKFLVDATGPRGFLHRALGLVEDEFPGFPHTQALYSHFSNVERFAVPDPMQPYPADDAALHHVFDGGWIWVLRFNNGLTSAGVAAVDQVANRIGFEAGAPAWDRLLAVLPAVKEQFAGSRPEMPFVHARKLSFLSAAIAGRRWALLPSAAGFIDPLLSTGFPLTLLGVSRLGDMIAEHWNEGIPSDLLQGYAEQTRRELLATARLIGSLYSAMDNFPLFASLSMLYFAAASFAESARRLDVAHLASSFLLCDDPVFGPAFDRLCAHPDSAEILRAIEPFNVAGWGRAERRNWYPVEADDLIQAAGKLGLSSLRAR